MKEQTFIKINKIGNYIYMNSYKSHASMLFMPAGIYNRSEEHRRKMSQIKKASYLSEAFRKKMSDAHKGHVHSEEHKEKIRNSCLGINKGSKHGLWKGDDVGYYGLHYWLRTYYPKPLLCEFCNKQSPKEIANITGIYNRDFENWKYLCRKCHRNFDRPWLKNPWLKRGKKILPGDPK